MKWSDEGIVISLKRYGEKSLIATILTKEHGKHLGIVKNKNINIGSKARCTWQARVSSQLGIFICEEIESFAHELIMNKKFLFLFNSAKSMVEKLIPEREQQHLLYDSFLLFMHEKSLSSYIKFEIELLRLLGLKINYNHCYCCDQGAVYVSPMSGAGSCAEHAKGYEAKLLKAPKDSGCVFSLNSFFLEKYIYPSLHIKDISARKSLKSYLADNNKVSKCAAI